MANETKNETKTNINLYNFIKDNRDYTKCWAVEKHDNKYVQNILAKASKKGTGKPGYPDFIYVNEIKKLLILIESKDNVKNHISKTENNPVDFAVDGIKHYLSFFTKKNLSQEKETIKKYFEHWMFVGLAFSGNINEKYNHRLDTFIIDSNNFKNITKNEVLDEEDYLAFFEKY